MSDFAEGYAVGQGNNNCGGMYGMGEWIWIIVLFALWQNGGFGFGGGYGNCATQADIAAGFNNSAVLNNLNSIEHSLCEGFSGVDKGLCEVRHSIYTSTRDIIDNANANNRAILDFLVQDKLATKDARIAQLENRISQSEQNAYLTATIDATKAELIRRLGMDYPTAAYIVQPPTPVTFPVNACGQVTYGNGGCGCGC
jgi:hypothetical protein